MRARTALALLLALTAVAVGAAPPASAAPDAKYRVELRGAQEGDSEGNTANPHGNADRGVVVVTLYQEVQKVCYRVTSLTLKPGDALPSMGHIHKGRRGVNGDVKVTLFGPGSAEPPEAYPMELTTCVFGSSTLIGRMIEHPARYYVNFHNTQHPGGVMRGQLVTPS